MNKVSHQLMLPQAQSDEKVTQEEDFNDLMERYLLELRGTARKLTGTHAEADDLVQDAALRAWRYWDNFEEGTNRRAWMHSIMRNTNTNRFRRVKLESEATQRLERESLAPVEYTVVPEPFVDEFSDEVQDALETLSDEFREVLVRVDVEGETYLQVSESIGCPVGTVMSRLYRARRQLKAALEAQAHGERRQAPECADLSEVA